MSATAFFCFCAMCFYVIHIFILSIQFFLLCSADMDTFSFIFNLLSASKPLVQLTHKQVAVCIV